MRSGKEAESRTARPTLKEIGQNIEDEISKVEAPTVILDGTSGELVPIEKTKKIAGKFHPGAGETLGEKVRKRKVVYFEVGGVTGEHGHNVINTFPEGVAVFINHAVDKYFPPATESVS